MISYRPFRKKRTFFLPAAIILLAIIMSVSAFRDLFGVRSLLISSLYPFQYASRQVWRGAVGIPPSLFSLATLAQKNSELKQKLDTAQAKTALYNELVAENQRLREALAFRQNNRFGFDLLLARIIGHGAAPEFSILQLDRGSSAGVKVDMPVIVKEGLVGRVVEVSRLSSKVLLITDNLSSVAAVDQQTRDYGVVEGFSPNTLLMRYVNGGDDIQVGEAIVTSPISGIFPAGIPIGKVARVTKSESDLFYGIEVRPEVNFSALEEVFLVF